MACFPGSSPAAIWEDRAVHFGIEQIVVGFVATFVGAVVQGSIGFGLSLLSAPFIAIVAPTALPGAAVLVSMPGTASLWFHEHHAVDRPALHWMLLGAIPGTLVGLAIVVAVDGDTLAVVVGAITLTSVGLSLLRLHLKVTPGSSFVAGAISNIFGTASSVGGPPVALLLQRHAGPSTRATLGAFFTLSSVASVVGYLLADQLRGYQVTYALVLLPAVLIGQLIGRGFHPRIDGGWLRPCVLTLSAIAGAAALVSGLA
jgi:uncharacterized membrane protein YfcA